MNRYCRGCSGCGVLRVYFGKEYIVLRVKNSEEAVKEAMRLRPSLLMTGRVWTVTKVTRDD